MSSKWKRAKQALRIKLGLFIPSSSNGHDSPASDAALLSLATTPTPSSRLFRLSKSFTRSSSKKTCTICLATMEIGDGHAIFTAECTHSFHFHCIVSNVKHGNHFCPICRAKWKEIPFEGPTLDPSPRSRQRLISPLDNAIVSVIRRPPSPRPNPNHHITPPLNQNPEPAIFNDDENLNHQPHLVNQIPVNNNSSKKVKIDTFPEIPAVARLVSCENFTVLIHLKAPVSSAFEDNTNLSQNMQNIRAPIDLVTVLDISGSMAGTKLALLKRAMGFVIQNLSGNDRLSVIAFSSTARRLFPLKKMSEKGKQESLQAVNSLTANGGTNIAEGLRKGVKILEDRREKNPVASIILLSDGQDTYTATNATQKEPNYHFLLPQSIYGNDTSASKIPVHAFGFGTDHDASAMHAISDISGGTFSFIETEAAIQDAFAQCIGGLLSVVVKNLEVKIECVQTSLESLRAGSYRNGIGSDRRSGFVKVGDLYAEEERDFLVSLTVPAEPTLTESSLLKVICIYTDPLTKNNVIIEGEEVVIQRPIKVLENMAISIEVDRQRNRLEAAEAMARAKTVAEQGDLCGAVNILENFRKILLKSVSAVSNDKLCVALDLEMKEMQERMASRHVYEASGRAYILSGLSSHSWQRATARGDSTHSSSSTQSYQTPSMAHMLSRSHASTLLASPSVAQKPR